MTFRAQENGAAALLKDFKDVETDFGGGETGFETVETEFWGRKSRFRISEPSDPQEDLLAVHPIKNQPQDKQRCPSEQKRLVGLAKDEEQVLP